jgi:hypothetical protein
MITEIQTLGNYRKIKILALEIVLPFSYESSKFPYHPSKPGN